MGVFYKKDVVYLTCQNSLCATVFQYRRGGGLKFCSRSCSTAARNHIKHQTRRQVDPVRSCICSYCKVSFVPKDRKGRKFCSHECYKNYNINIIHNFSFEKLSWERKRKKVIFDQGGKCLWCSLANWGGVKLSLQIDHIDGNNKNDDRKNLRALCSNCHSITPTWRGGNQKIRVSDEELKAALNATENVRQALQCVGLTPKGGSYKRANRLKNSSA